MKRIYAFLALLPIVTACEIGVSQVNPITSHTLENYAKKKMVEYVALPVEALEFAIEFDGYLKLSDLEQERTTDSSPTPKRSSPEYMT